MGCAELARLLSRIDLVLHITSKTGPLPFLGVLINENVKKRKKRKDNYNL